MTRQQPFPNPLPEVQEDPDRPGFALVPVCPTCRLPRRPAHILALALKAAAIPVRDAHTKLDQPTHQRDGAWALGRLDEARGVLEPLEDSCCCPDDHDVRRRMGLALGLSDEEVTLAAGVRVQGDGYTIAGATVPPPASRSSFGEATGDEQVRAWKFSLDAVAAALHPEWAGTRGNAYVADHLPAMIAQLRRERDATDRRLAALERACQDDGTGRCRLCHMPATKGHHEKCLLSAAVPDPPETLRDAIGRQAGE